MATTVLRTLAVRLQMNSAQFRKDMDKIDARTRSFSRTMRNQANMFSSSLAQMGLGLASAFSFAQLAEAADEMKNMRNKLGAVYTEATNVKYAMMDVKRIAKESRAEIGAVGTLYQRLAKASEKLGVTQQEVAAVTQVVTNTFTLSGTTAQEAANSARQFAQGIASGKLAGDELRSVLENNVVLGQMLAEGFGLTVGELRKFAAAGGLTAERILPILVGRLDETNQAIAKMRMTLGQARTIMSNSFAEMVDRIDTVYGVSDKAARVILKLAENIHIVTLAVGSLATILVTRLIVAFVAWVALGIWSAITAVGSLITVTVLLGKWLLRLGGRVIVLLLTKLSALAVALAPLAVTFVVIATKVALLASLFWMVYSSMTGAIKGFKHLSEAGGSYMDALTQRVMASLDNIKILWVKFQRWLDSMDEAVGFEPKFGGTAALDAQIAALEAAQAKVRKGAEDLENEAGNSLSKFMSVWGQEFGKSMNQGIDAITQDLPSFLSQLADKAKETFDPVTGPAGTLMEWIGNGEVLQNLGERFGLTVDQIKNKILEASPEISRFWKLMTGELDPDAGGEAQGAPGEWYDQMCMTMATATIAMVDMIKKSWRELSDSIKASVSAMIDKYKTWDDVLAAGAQKSKKLAAVRRALMIREAIMMQGKAIMDAWGSYPFPANLPGVALVTAQTALVLRDIMAQGQAHDGMDSLPSTGTYMLQRGERVVSTRVNRDLTQYLADANNARSMVQPNLTLQVNGVSDPDMVVQALNQRMPDLRMMMRNLAAENSQSAFV